MRVHIFARAPVAGACKTRLIPRLGARGAAWVQRRLVERALNTACTAVGAENVTLWGAPDATHGFFMHCRQRFGVRLARQARGDLGAKMRSSLSRAPGLLIGSDAFGLQADDLRRAAAALRSADHVLLPARDGGYVLIGSRKRLPSLAGVAWSSGRECAQTARRLARSGKLTWVGPARDDFDSAADWRRARRLGQLKPLVRGVSAD
ncbi:MAG: TIGR04282 family arsenosugar biosynthesis glycosyltransferase [Pseudomonadota bacterium]